ncbi:MAG TPA: hypothetical protein VN794_18620 [Methylomirabilota bacterium]|nr:hypothetical protein [Methylomirabilota bacterium]
MTLVEQARVLREVLSDRELTLLQIQTATTNQTELRQAIALALHMSTSDSVVVAGSTTTH